MSLGDVQIVMFYGRPENVILMQSVKFNTVTFLKYSFSVPPGSKNNWVYSMSHNFWRDVSKDVLIASQSDVCIVTSLGHSQGVNFKHNTQHITDVLFSILHTNVLCRILNHCLFFKFSRNVLWTSSKRPEKTYVGWRPWDVPRTSILNLSYKCIFTALFSVLFHQMCAWTTKELAVL